jgi:hypothetical protein
MFGFFDANSSVNSEVRQRTPLITYAQIVERTTAWVLQHIGTRKFLWFVLLFFFVTHLYRINDPPVGFHKWRETDTVAVAYNFYTENWNFFKPRIDLRGAGDGIVGMELPIYSYATALLFALFGYSHIWPRLLTVLGTCLFLLGLHRLSKALTGSVAFAGLTTFLASVSPLVVFYGRKIQPDIWALALAVNGLAFFVSWVVKNQAWHGVFSAVCVALGAAVKPIPQETKVIVYDWTPGVLLYRTGRKGWRIDRSADLSIFLEAIRGGAQFFVVEDDYSDDLTPFKSYIGPPVYRHEGITVYPIVATAPTDAPLPRPQWASR